VSAVTTTTRPLTASRRPALRAWLLWTTGFLAFPVAGLAGTAVAGRLDGPTAAVLGGLATGAVLGLGQALVSSGRLPLLRWTVATAVGMGVGLLLGARAVDYGTTIEQLAVMGALTGAVLGPAQALVLPHRARRRWAWALAMPVVWATGWTVTTAAGIAVEEQFTLFGASGAVTATALLGVLLQGVLPTPARRKDSATTSSITATTSSITATTGSITATASSITARGDHP
jgi:hypothetical protein